MPDSSVLFVVPQETDKLAEILAEHGGYLEYERPDADFAGYLAARIGSRISATFEDQDDPSAPLYEFCTELESQNAPYFGVSAPYEERSRGDRYDGYVAYNIGNGLVQKIHPWRDGDPSIDERSLRVAGVSEDEIARVAEVMFAPTSSLKAGVP